MFLLFYYPHDILILIQNIPDNNANGVTASMSISDSFFVERVVVRVTIDHDFAGMHIILI